MNTNNGGNMTASILFGLSFATLIAALVVYVMKDDTASKKWAEQTKSIVTANEKLVAEWQASIALVKGLCDNHGVLAGELERQKTQVDKLEFAIKNTPAPQLHGSIDLKPTRPLEVVFTPITVRHVKGVKKTQPHLNGAAKPTPVEKKVINKIKKQMKQLSQ